MESEQNQNVSTENQTSSEEDLFPEDTSPKNSSGITKLIVVVFLLVLIATVVAVRFLFNDNPTHPTVKQELTKELEISAAKDKSVATTSIALTEEELRETYLTTNDGLMVTLPEGWEQLDPKDVFPLNDVNTSGDYSSGGVKPSAVFENSQNRCQIAYFEANGEDMFRFYAKLQPYEVAQVNPRNISGDQYFPIFWRQHVDEVNDYEDFNKILNANSQSSSIDDYTSIVLTAFLTSWSDSSISKTSFALINKDKTKMIDLSCTKDFTDMLDSVRYPYTETKLTNLSTGYLSVVSEKILDKEVDRLLFHPTGSDRKLEIDSFDGSGSPLPQVHGNELYLIVNNRLTALNPFTLEKRDVLKGFDQDENHRVQSHIIRDNLLYFLAGKFCLYYKAECNLGLYEYNIELDKATLLADNISQRRLGYTDDGKTLIARYDWGDAGCVSTNSAVFDINSGNLEDGPSYSGCYGDSFSPDDSEEQLFGVYNFSSNIKNVIEVRDGQLTAPRANVDGVGTNWSFDFY